MNGLLMVALGGMAGALSRFAVQKVMPQIFLPAATLTVNLL